MKDSKEYVLNQMGAKILMNSTKSYNIFVEEIGNLEFLLMYIMLAEHSEKDEFKNHLIEHYEKDKNIASDKLIEFLKSVDGNSIFNVASYERYFGQMAYTRITDNALSYFKDVLSEVVRKKPTVLKSNEQESIEYIMSFNTMEDLILDITERKVKKLFYGNISKIKKFFLDKLGIELFNDEQAESNFLLLTKQRNLIVHNRGIITKELADEFPNFENMIGQHLHFGYEQLSEINKIINNIIVEIDIKLIKKFKLDSTSLR